MRRHRDADVGLRWFHTEQLNGFRLVSDNSLLVGCGCRTQMVSHLTPSWFQTDSDSDGLVAKIVDA